MGDIFKDVLTYQGTGGGPELAQLLLYLLTTFVLGQIIAWVYVGTHRGISYAVSVAQALIVLAMIVSLVMAVVGSNVARAFGLFGALALIRFRTPVKDARDTVYLFLSVALGIATGTGNLLAALVGVTLICLLLLHLTMSRFGDRLDHDGLLRFRVPVGNELVSHAVNDLLERFCSRFRLLQMREADDRRDVEHALEITLVDPAETSRLVAELERLTGVHRVSLLMQDTEAQP